MKVVSVKFKENGRAYYFDPGEFKIKEGDFVTMPMEVTVGGATVMVTNVERFEKL